MLLELSKLLVIFQWTEMERTCSRPIKRVGQMTNYMLAIIKLGAKPVKNNGGVSMSYTMLRILEIVCQEIFL